MSGDVLLLVTHKSYPDYKLDILKNNIGILRQVARSCNKISTKQQQKTINFPKYKIN